MTTSPSGRVDGKVQIEFAQRLCHSVDGTGGDWRLPNAPMVFLGDSAPIRANVEATRIFREHSARSPTFDSRSAAD